MLNYFLYNQSIELNDQRKFISGFEEIIPIKVECEQFDHLYKHDSVWALKNVLDLFYNNSFSSAAIIKFIEQLNSCEISTFEENLLDQNFPNMFNAFLGIDFSITNVSLNRRINNLTSFLDCKQKYIWSLTPTTFWQRRDFLFPHLVLCGEVESQLSKIGNSSYFNQIIKKLKTFDQAIKLWNNGNFNYRLINQGYSLNISPESEQTMAKYGNERVFSLPDGSRKNFELHIKTGDLRFHFYADNVSHKVYIGYIGPHLTIVSD